MLCSNIERAVDILCYATILQHVMNLPTMSYTEGCRQAVQVLHGVRICSNM